MTQPATVATVAVPQSTPPASPASSSSSSFPYAVAILLVCGAAALLLHERYRFVSGFVVHIDDRYSRAFTCEQERGLATYAATCTRNQCHLAL